MQGGAHAVVYVDMPVRGVHQSVVGIRQGRVGWKPYQAATVQNFLQARLFSHDETPPESLLTEAFDGPWY